jgi:uncharacterized protein (DUF2336 family)
MRERAMAIVLLQESRRAVKEHLIQRLALCAIEPHRVRYISRANQRSLLCLLQQEL